MHVPALPVHKLLITDLAHQTREETHLPPVVLCCKTTEEMIVLFTYPSLHLLYPGILEAIQSTVVFTIEAAFIEDNRYLGQIVRVDFLSAQLLRDIMHALSTREKLLNSIVYVAYLRG